MRYSKIIEIKNRLIMTVYESHVRIYITKFSKEEKRAKCIREMYTKVIVIMNAGFTLSGSLNVAFRNTYMHYINVDSLK